MLTQDKQKLNSVTAENQKMQIIHILTFKYLLKYCSVEIHVILDWITKHIMHIMGTVENVI